MSLSNRVAIAVGEFNYGHETFWMEVHGAIGISMAPTLSLHLQKKDAKNEKRRENDKKPSVKLRRALKQIDLTNQLMEMECKDREKRAMYGSGTGISTTGIVVTEKVKTKENDLKTILGSKCKNYRCYASGHKTRQSMKCKYHTCKSQKEVDDETDSFMRLKYPKCYEGTKQM